MEENVNTGKIKGNEIEKDNKPVTKIKTFWRELEADHGVVNRTTKRKQKPSSNKKHAEVYLVRPLTATNKNSKA